MFTFNNCGYSLQRPAGSLEGSYLLIPWSKVLLEKLIGLHLVK